MGRGWKRIAPDADAAPVPYPTKPDQGTARHGDRPHQLHAVLGQSVSCVADRRGLCTDAGTAPFCGGHKLRKSAGLDTARTLPETGGEGRCLSAAHGHTLAAIVPVSDDLPAHGDGTWSINWVKRHRSPEEFPFSPDPTDNKGKPRPKIVAALMVYACKACRHVPHSNFTLPSSSQAIFCHAKSSLAGRSRIMQVRGFSISPCRPSTPPLTHIAIYMRRPW